MYRLNNPERHNSTTKTIKELEQKCAIEISKNLIPQEGKKAKQA
jgi:hypothetical protein